MFELIKNGSWLDASRIRRVAVISGAITLVALIWLAVTAQGTLDYLGRPIGTDFSNVWTAGHMALDRNAPLAWDWPSHHAVQKTAHNKADVDFFGWHYPPPFLLVASLLALLPYVAALVLYQASTLALVAATLRQIDPGRTAMIAGLGAPVVLVCLTHGHNGFLTAALLGSGLLLLDKKPVIAGILLGCMIYKPQFGLVLPLMLVFGGHWRAIGSAVASALLLCGLTIWLWGWPVWDAFFNSLPLTQSVIIEQGITGWQKIQSVFSAFRNWGANLATAYAAQSIGTLLALAGTAFVSRGANVQVRNAAVMAAALFSTPYILDYDLVPLGIATAFLVCDGRARGYLDWEKTLYAIVWMSPLIGRAVMTHTTVPIGCLSIAAILFLALRRAWHFDRDAIATRWPIPMTSRIVSTR